MELFQCELYHWADVLDLFDSVLEKGCAHQSNKSWTMACDLPGNGQVRIRYHSGLKMFFFNPWEVILFLQYTAVSSAVVVDLLTCSLFY